MKTAVAEEISKRVRIASTPDEGETLVVAKGEFTIEKNTEVIFASGDVYEVMSDGTRGMNVGSFVRDYRNGASNTNTANGYDPDAMQTFVREYIETVKETEGWV